MAYLKNRPPKTNGIVAQIQGDRMLNQLNSVQRLADERALKVTDKYLTSEWDLIEALCEVNRTKAHRMLGFTSLFKYSVDRLGLAEGTAYALISVARKSKEIPALKNAVKSKALTAYKASRMVSALTKENASELIEFAKKNSTRAIEFEVRRLNPKINFGHTLKPVGENLLQITITVTKEEFEIIQRAEDLAAGKGIEGRKDTLVQTYREYVQRHDPVEKAKRSIKRKERKAISTEKICAPRIFEGGATEAEARVKIKVTRIPLTAEQKHAVFARDGGRCTFKETNGQRCDNTRWLQVHHIVHVKDGGTNDPENLTTYCSCHHDLVHQLSLPIEGQVTWLRSPNVKYGSRAI